MSEIVANHEHNYFADTYVLRCYFGDFPCCFCLRANTAVTLFCQTLKEFFEGGRNEATEVGNGGWWGALVQVVDVRCFTWKFGLS